MIHARGGEDILYESILDSIKKILGMPPEYEAFDVDLIMHINTIFGVLTQIGIGPKDGYSISDSTALWSDYLGASSKIEMVKTYIALRVRMIFDPPTASAVAEAMKNQISELEWRLSIQAG